MLERLRDALRGEDVQLAYLFGSEARGDAGRGSDVDVAVLTSRPCSLMDLGALADRLSSVTGGRRVQVVDLRVASPLLRAEVAREGVVLLARDAGIRLDFELDAIRREIDTRFLRKVQRRLLRERLGLLRERLHAVVRAEAVCEWRRLGPAPEAPPVPHRAIGRAGVLDCGFPRAPRR